MEFYLELMRLFYREGENFLGIHCGLNCLLAAQYVYAPKYCSECSLISTCLFLPLQLVLEVDMNYP